MMSKALKTVGARRLRLLAGAAAAAAAAILVAPPALAQGQIWRCGNEYTNQPGERPEARGCRLLQGGNLSIVEGRRPAANQAAGAAASSPVASNSAPRAPASTEPRPPSQRVDRSEQQARDRDARLILETELRRAQERVRELQAEFNQGRPQPLPSERGDEARLAQRTEELRRRLERAQGDVTAIEREIGRLPSVQTTAAAAQGGAAAGPSASVVGTGTAARAVAGPAAGQFIPLPAAPSASGPAR
ncbi:hypothetical protein [Serpentinimonas maccroryi]|jgi:hypothetical protein|nr:hypothetical protein [Serpentinimonas maccroryi]MBA4252696.1 hypothetical protein [Comamonadaceae bacterium]OYX60456.1 MAG: hypothetical protein B7Y96_02005 [Comamonadaceae bacterium 32-67-11]OZA90471.1 MAG: hypothetical protein B7X56_02755 [Burkholderiales bacterium 34-67-9]